MILHSKLFLVGIGRNVEHVFDPVGTVWYLEFIPVGTVVFEAALPVKTKTQKFNVETILSSQVFDDKTRMDQMATDLLRRRPGSEFGRQRLCTKAMELPSGSRTRKDREPSESLRMTPGSRPCASR